VGVGLVCYLVATAVTGGLSELTRLSPVTYAAFVASGAVGAFAWLAYFAGLDRVGASVGEAGFTTHPLFATVIAFVVLGEALSPPTVLGITVVVAGLVVVATSEGGDREGWHRYELAFPLVAAAAHAVSNVVRRFGLTRTSVTTLEAITINVVATFLVLLIYAAATRDRNLAPPTDSFRYFLASGLVSAVAFLLLFEAFARGSVAVVSAIAGLAPVFATLIAAVFLADVERVTRGVLGGVVLVFVGVVLITTT
jgi:drug/metabolite transporter (DMT)-like permease